MSHRYIKNMRRVIRHDIIYQAELIKRVIRPKPKLVPQWLWERIVRFLVPQAKI